MEKAAKGTLIASAVAALLVACGGSNATGTSASAPSAADMAGKVKCTGVNECRAKGVCAQADHKCGAQNECRGKGITLASADDCTAKGGTAL